MALLLAAGAVPGSQLGFWLSKKIDGPLLKVLFALVLFATGLRVFTAAEPPDAAGGALSAAQLAWVPLIGLVGGFLTPLFGIGGGIVTVPALFLGFEEIGYVEARASSLAMSAVAAAWSLRNYLRSREVDRRAILPLVAATVAGSVAGTLAVHREGWADLARTILGALLLSLALRFASTSSTARGAESGVLAWPEPLCEPLMHPCMEVDPRVPWTFAYHRFGWQTVEASSTSHEVRPACMAEDRSRETRSRRMDIDIGKFADEAAAFERWLLSGADQGADAARECLIRLLELYRAGIELPGVVG